VPDCWLIAFSESSGARLVTFDKALLAQARKIGNRALSPA
jgi:predicted nucleic acid-binding protein